jgi:hypothetical protein
MDILDLLRELLVPEVCHLTDVADEVPLLALTPSLALVQASRAEPAVLKAVSQMASSIRT